MLKPLVTVSETLFSDLVGGLGQDRPARALVTANERLARAYRQAVEQRMSTASPSVFRTPRILSLRTWLDGEYQALRTTRPNLPRPMSETTCALLARQAAIEAHLDAPDRIVAQMLDAWRTGIAYGLDLDRLTYPRSDLFARWLRRFSALVSRTEALPSELVPARLAAESWLPAQQVIAVGFEELTLAQRDYCEQLVAAGHLTHEPLTLPDRAPEHARRTATDSFREELAAACRWARDIKLKHAEARIGIVVPSLAQRHAEVTAVCGFWLDRDRGARSPTFDITGGERLNTQAVWRDAKALLSGIFGELERAEFEGLCRSPFFPALNDVPSKARRGGGTRSRHVQLADVLAHQALEGIRDALAGLRGRHPLTGWWDKLQRVLWALDWPGGSTLVSRQYQAHASISEHLSRVTLDWSVSGVEALALFDRLLGDVPFAPERAGADVLVLGILETTGLEFSHLWVTEMNDVAFPGSAARNPFISTQVAARAGLPRSTPELELEFSKRMLTHWYRTSDALCFSYARYDAETELSASALIRNLPGVETAELEPYAHLLSAVTLDTYVDETGPATIGRVTGGTKLLTHQAQCPFRAFAEHRLDLRPPETHDDLLSALDRGIIVHAVVAELHRRFPTQAVLNEVDDSTLDALAEAALAQVRRPLPGVYMQHELARLKPLVRGWIAMELEREPFRTLATEEAFEIQVGALNLTIRVDRIDEVGGGICVLDYKTGASDLKGISGARLTDAQLPLYAQVNEHVRAVLYVELKPPIGLNAEAPETEARIRMIGMGDGALAPQVEADPEWPTRKAAWRRELEDLASAYARGHAAVDPVPGACDYCHLNAVCRIGA